MDVASFDDIAEEFDARVKKIVWCAFTTMDRQNRPRSRMLHPIWEGPVGWIATGRETLKTKHLADNPFASLTYWDPDHKQIYVETKTEWVDDQSEKERIWDLFKSTEPPLGYDPAMVWSDGVNDPGYGLLKLTPWRIEISGIYEMSSGQPPLVWRQSVS